MGELKGKRGCEVEGAPWPGVHAKMKEQNRIGGPALDRILPPPLQVGRRGPTQAGSDVKPHLVTLSCP